MMHASVRLKNIVFHFCDIFVKYFQLILEATALNDKRKIRTLEDTKELMSELKAKNLFEDIIHSHDFVRTNYGEIAINRLNIFSESILHIF